jgi:hypothetical protein
MRKFFLTILAIISTSIVFGQTGIPKAQSMFIYNFSRLIEWPASYKSGDFVIGVLGNSTVFNELQTFTASKKVGTQNISVEKFSDPSEITNCHILFVSFGKSNKMGEILTSIGNSSTLIIGEKNGLTSSGAAINFVIQQDKLKFEMNVDHATKNGLKVSSSLQNMAILVN